MIAPRALVHRGVVPADGLWLTGPDAAARALAAWTPGAQLWRVEEGLVLRWVAPRRLRAEEAPGAVLLAREGVLWAFPPTEAEWTALQVPREHLVVVVGGEARARPLGQALPPHALLEAEVQVLPLQALAAPPAPALGLAPPPVLDRAHFGQPPAHPEAATALAQLKRGGAGGGASRGPGGAGTGQSEPSALAVGTSLFLGGLLRLFSHRPRLEGPGVVNRLLDWLDRNALSGLLRANLGRRYSYYLSRLLDDLEERQLDRALRTAIPLSDAPGTKAAEGLNLRLPSPRTELRVLPAGGTANPVGLNAELFEELRRRYKLLAVDLEREHRYEDAAFVLAELLGQTEQAVTLLERRERFKLAADIAEARELPAARQVALRLRAGEVQRAMDLARRGGVMVEAARLLEKSAPDLARQLILAQVVLLAGTGQFLAALALLPAGREPRTEQAILQTALQGGDFLVMALAERFLASPGLRERWLGRAREILRREEPDEAQERLLVELARLSPGGVRSIPQSRQLAALCRDGARIAFREATRRGEVSAQTAISLAAHSPAMAEDLKWAPVLQQEALPTRLVRPAEDRGALPVYDVTVGEDRTWILALGEAGLELRAPGRPRRTLAVPAERVLCLGEQAIVMVRRGEVQELSRVDLRTGQATHWMDLPAARPAPMLTRGALLVAEETGVALFDPLSTAARALWRGGPKVAVPAMSAGESTAIFALVEQEGQRELWRWSREDLLLRERTTLQDALPGAVIGLNNAGMLLEAVASSAEPVLALRTSARPIKGLLVQEHPALPVGVPCAPTPLAVHCGDHGFHVALRRLEGGVLVLRYSIPDAGHSVEAPTVSLTLLGARRVGFGLSSWSAFTVWDDVGRVLRVGARGGVTRELRS